LHTPKGTRDYLPDEVRTYRYFENELREIFEFWGYQEIRSSTLEFVEALSIGVGPDIIDRMFKFQDFDGKMLALRTEMTTPIARIVTAKMASCPEPIRLFYITNVFRHSQSYVGRGREFWQAGVELIGCDTPETDGEILSLVVSCLKKLGLSDVRVDIGHADLLRNLLNATGLDEGGKENLRSFLAYHDNERLEKFLDGVKVPCELREIFLRLSRCRKLGDLSSLPFNSTGYGKVENHVGNLLKVEDVLVDYGVESSVFFDFSLTRKIEYYTGIVFEASVPNMGLPVGGGGRYNNLIEKFGDLRLPATGFALQIENCLQALQAQGLKIPENGRPAILVTSNFRKTAIEAAKTLREAGFLTSIDLQKADEKKTIDYAKLLGMDYVVFMGSSISEPVRIYDLEMSIFRNTTLSTFMQQNRGRSA
jgi:ATP phosphoribosyltransferase regulatory subunit